MAKVIFNGCSTYENLRLTRYEVKQYIENNKELQELMKKYGITWRFKNVNSHYDWDEEIYFCDYNVKDRNDFSNIDNFITELKRFPLFLISKVSDFYKNMFGHTYDRTIWQIDDKGKNYHFIYFNNYSFKEDDVKKGVVMDDNLIEVIKTYFNDVLHKDYNVIQSTGKHNFEGDVANYDALVVIGGGKDNTRLIDQLYVFTTCVYNTQTNMLELSGRIHNYEIPYMP